MNPSYGCGALAAALQIDPWSAHQFTDYARLRDEFGIEAFDEALEQLEDPPPIFRRGVVFGHRGFDTVLRAIRLGEPWVVLTGLMPSGSMHMGHKMVIDQVTYFQELGAEVFLAVADLESYATRGMSLEQGRELAIEEYARNYLALGLDPDQAQVYFQSRRREVQQLAFLLGKRVNWSTFQAVYGFDGETTMSHAHAPLVQAADILHPQLPEHGGPRPVLVPVGVDQDPHIRLTRDLANATRLFSIKQTDKGLGIFVKVEEDDANLARVARHEGIAEGDTVEHLIERASKLLDELGFADLEANVGYRALYATGASIRDKNVVDVPLAKLEQAVGELGFVAPASTYHRFMSGLTGDKMSSSEPASALFLTDDRSTAEDKLSKAKTGGRATADEQRRLGANPYVCPVFEMYLYHLMPEDEDLKDIEAKCSGGEILCGECKGIAKELATQLLADHQAGREAAGKDLETLVRDA